MTTPPAKARTPKPRAYDPARTRAAVLAQIAHVRAAVAGLDEEMLARPAGLGDWTVRELVAHMARGAGAVVEAVDRAGANPPGRRIALADWAFATSSVADRIDEIAHEWAEEKDLAALHLRMETRFRELLERVPGETELHFPIGTMTLAEFLVTRTVELVVHTDDLNRATGLDVPVERQALAACVRLLADAMARKAPGGAVELRIPPFAVVQCVEGPRHTRGTPPNVVETDPLTWLRLATGRSTWAEETDAARVRAGGERSDLSGLLPVMS
ncbi:sterol carrier family protein [Streptomyces sp. BI20]|uniref:maleylpyruvate isomerase family mycothiol-dependent enzyme n=1 Tax=Streptomyces sp. BI20 TaxID=3403460 RepID=UPI003C748DBE